MASSIKSTNCGTSCPTKKKEEEEEEECIFNRKTTTICLRHKQVVYSTYNMIMQHS